MYVIIITPRALKVYNGLPKSEQIKFKKKLLSLETNPLEGKKLFGEYKDSRSLKAWPYRIIYYINEKEKKVFVVTIAHRQGVYR